MHSQTIGPNCHACLGKNESTCPFQKKSLPTVTRSAFRLRRTPDVTISTTSRKRASEVIAVSMPMLWPSVSRGKLHLTIAESSQQWIEYRVDYGCTYSLGANINYNRLWHN
ncbi:MAG: hypothetical protein OS130_01770 [Thermodesulfobacteriota bacterium]|nr:MAG: hypothetical protein OS130_01770 [Thermodesulfobacteriota bacterium]